MSELRSYEAPAKSSALGPELAGVASTGRPGPGAIELARARDYHARGADGSAEELLQNLLMSHGSAGGQARDETIASAWSLYGRVLASLRREDEALTAFQRAVALFDRVLTPASPVSGQVRSDYGRALYLTGDSGRAAEQLKRALQLDYLTQGTMKYLGLALAHQGDPEGTYYLEQALLLKPDDADTQVALAICRGRPDGFIQLGHFLRGRGDGEGSIKAFERALELADQDSDDRAEALVGLGMTLLVGGRPAEAVERFQEATGNEVWAFRGHEYLAEAFRLLDRPTEALASIDRALELARDAYALGTRGQILAALGRVDEAIEQLRAAADLEPGSDWIYVELIPLMRQAGRIPEAVARLQRLTRQSGSAWSFAQLGFLLAELDRGEEAIVALEQAASLSPDNEQIYQTLTPLLRSRGRLEDAARHLQALTAARPDSGWGFADLGETLRLLGRGDEALAALDRALELNPDWGYVLGTKGQILRARGDLAGARELLEQALRADSSLDWAKEELALAVENSQGPVETLALLDRLLAEDAAWERGHARRGALLRASERFDEARESLEEAVRLDPRDSYALQELGECLRMLNRPEDAIAMLDRALAVNPNNAFALASKAAALNARDEWDKALEVVRQAREQDPDNGFAVGVEAVTLRNLKRPAEAIEMLHDALALRPDDVGILSELGETLRYMDREEEAVEVLNRALGQEPDNAFCLATRGYALRALERHDEALRDLRRAIEIVPNYAWAHGSLSHVCLEIAALQQSAEHAARAFVLDNTLVWCRGLEGYAHALLGNLAAARDAAREAHELEPEEVGWTQNLADCLMALGEPGADELFREVIERGSAASDPSTLAVVAWSHRRLGEHDPAARTYQRALTLGGRQLEYIRLDFALALLCSGRAELALREYERAVQALQYVHPLRAYGLLVTAGQDLEQAERLSQVPDAADARQLLAAALAKYQPQATTESTESRPDTAAASRADSPAVEA